MRALVYDPQAPTKLRFDEVSPPVAAENEVLIDVRAIALNFGELHWIDRARQPGDVPGWDTAGVIRQAAANGSGPPVGTRVAGLGFGAGWAQQRVLSTNNLAVLPDGVGFETAAALPVAGATALQALRELGPVVGRRVLITGASGGVGRFAVQLAARAGAHVIAAVGSTARGTGLSKLGADEIVVGVNGIDEPVFGVLDNVGGSLLADAYRLVDDGGSVQSIGMASGEPTTIDFEELRRIGGRKRLEPFTIHTPLGDDLQYLVTLVHRGQLDPQIGLRDSWDNIASAADALFGRRVAGKAVLSVS